MEREESIPHHLPASSQRWKVPLPFSLRSNLLNFRLASRNQLNSIGMLTFNQVCENPSASLKTREGLQWLIGYALAINDYSKQMFAKSSVECVLSELHSDIDRERSGYNNPDCTIQLPF